MPDDPASVLAQAAASARWSDAEALAVAVAFLRPRPALHAPFAEHVRETAAVMPSGCAGVEDAVEACLAAATTAAAEAGVPAPRWVEDRPGGGLPPAEFRFVGEGHEGLRVHVTDMCVAGGDDRWKWSLHAGPHSECVAAGYVTPHALAPRG